VNEPKPVTVLRDGKRIIIGEATILPHGNIHIEIQESETANYLDAGHLVSVSLHMTHDEGLW
jgi:hypothetical protein